MGRFLRLALTMTLGVFVCSAADEAVPLSDDPVSPVSGASPASATAADADVLSQTLRPVETPQAGVDRTRPYVVTQENRFDWQAATSQSMLLLTVQHGVRLGQEKTHTALDGPFFSDYAESVKGLSGWRDGDDAFTNYWMHPLQGAITSFIQIQNDPVGRTLRITDGSRYWKSRLKGLAWSTAYSTQFELGPYSEATIGNVGQIPGTMGWVDLVMTPVGGFAIVVAEDLVDEYMVAPLEKRTTRSMKRFLRIVFGPSRTVTNLLRMKKPWRRDSREYIPPYVHNAPPRAPTAVD